jgi:hypothetical protein
MHRMSEEGNMSRRIACLSVLLVILAIGVGETRAAEYESAGERKASEILPPEILQGPHYRVREVVPSDGYMHQFTVDSDFGAFEVTGDLALRKLVREIYAIAALQQIKGTDAFAAAVTDAAKAPVALGKNLITNPVDTVTGIPKGVFRLFSNVGTSATSSRDPSEDSRLETALLLSTYKRDYAAQLGVDVYSSNRVLQKELNSVGWAAAIGNWGTSLALTPVSGPAVSLFKTTRLANSANELLKAEPPPRLRQINAEKLTAMGVGKDLQTQFLDHPDFTPRHDTILVQSLASLAKARGRDAFVKLALSADDEASANFFTQMAETLRGYHQTVSPIRQITVAAPVVLAQTANGSVLVPYPLDDGIWTRRADENSSRILAKHKGLKGAGAFEFWVTGTLSPLARQQLTARGVTVVENVDARIDFVD